MRLSELLKNFIDLKKGSFSDPVITHLTCDSRQVKPGSLFFAFPGVQREGRQFILQALRQGADAVVFEAIGATAFNLNSSTVPLVPLENVQAHIGHLAARFYGDLSAKLVVIGVTGTNGKTSCTHYLAQALAQQQRRCAIAGTIGNGFLPELQPSQLTTLDAVSIQQHLADFVRQGADTVAMEVSSHSLVQHRVAGIHFTIAVLTQLSRDHLDYHGSMEAYAAAKAQLFAQPGLSMAVLNADDALGQQLIQHHAHQLNIIAYSAQGQLHPSIPSVAASRIATTGSGFHFHVVTPWGEGEVSIPLLGLFNVSNVLAVLSVLGLLNIPLSAALPALANLQPVCGRMQQLGGGDKPLVIVDYAHTPDALAQALSSLRQHKPHQLWCVFGCGGDRDRGKRPLMAEVAARLADRIVITNDNPRTESPQQIITDICVGLPADAPVMIKPDRAAAIAYAVQQAKPGDMVLIAGKGHETVQIVGEQHLPFSDQDQVNLVLGLGIR